MKHVVLACAVLALAAPPALADTSTTIEVEPGRPLKGTHRAVVMKSPILALALSAGLPMAVAAPALTLKTLPAPLATGLVIGAPVLTCAGQLYAGDPMRGLANGLMGPVVTAAGWGVGLALGQPTNGMYWGFGLYTAWAALDAYVSADLNNKKALAQLGITDTP